MMTSRWWTPRRRVPQPLDAAFTLPGALAGMLLIGAVAASGRVGGVAVLVLTCLLVGAIALISEPLTALPLAAIGWFTVAGFGRPPYGELHLSGTAPAGIIVTAAAGSAVLARLIGETRTRYRVVPPDERVTLEGVRTPLEALPQVCARRGTRSTLSCDGSNAPAISRRRLIAGLTLAAIELPVLTLALTAARPHLGLTDEALVYLLGVILVTIVGGFWPAVLASLAEGLLLNWFFTEPVHTWTIDAPQNILALLLFVLVAVTVSSVVHLAARRSALASERASDASTMLSLARTVHSGDDSPQTIIDHLAASLLVDAELLERSGSGWVRIAGTPGTGTAIVLSAGEDLRLAVRGDMAGVSRVVLDGYAAQAAAALERHRLRIQANQAEALAEGNRMRTALLAAVGHDLRTPLASLKVAVSTLRQNDVAWTAEDQAALLATIEQSADRLNALIGNLLDMSRVQAGALQPFVRPTALDEVAPLVARGLDDGDKIVLDLPDSLPLIVTDPGLLERALANLVSNALRYSPPEWPPTLIASDVGTAVRVLIVDHGPGVPEHDRERIFEPFQQLGDRHTAEGVGLGLAVAKGFIESMGGRIVATDTLGGGLTMCVELPIAALDGVTQHYASR